MRRSARQIETAIAKLEQSNEPWYQPGVLVIPDTVPPELWMVAVLIEQAEMDNAHADLTQCLTCGYPTLLHSLCVSCNVERPQSYLRKMEWPQGGGALKIPFRFRERRFLVTTQQRWCEARGVSSACSCGAPLAVGQAQCLLCLDTLLYPSEPRLIQ